MTVWLRSRRLWAAFLLAVVAAGVLPFVAGPSQAQAHPLGNFTINHYSRLELSRDGIRLRYVIDMAEIPAFQEIDRIDVDGDGAVTRTEGDAYLRQQVALLGEGLFFKINERPVAIEPVASALTFPPGQGGLNTLRVVIDFVAAMPEGWEDNVQQAQYRDDNYRGRLGWREIIVRSVDGVRVFDSTVPAEDISDELRSYPDEGINNPLRITSAVFSFEPGLSTSAGGAAGTAPVLEPEQAERATRGNPDPTLERYADLIAKESLSAGVVAAALVAALGFGALHALSPGHGKTVVAAYLVGTRGTARQALLLGLTVTATHTASVYALGFVTLYLSAYILPEDLYPWLSTAAGALILAMGLSLFVGRLRSSRLLGDALGWLGARLGPALTPGVALVGAPAAIDGPHVHDATLDRGSSHDDGETPTHGSWGVHAHALPGQERLSWRGLVGLGVFGGLLPCPSAIIVMLSAISLQRVALGLLLIVAFSVGLAGVLTAIGFALVFAGRLPERLPFLRALTRRATGAGAAASFAARAFPVGSAVVVAIAGLVVALRGLMAQGFL